MRTFKPTTQDLEAIAEFEQALRKNDTEQLATFEEHCTREFSGKLNIRIPKELHEQLVKSANKNGVSLNQYILYKLASH